MEEKNKCAHTGFIGGCCLPGEEKMREWITWQKDRLLPPEAIAEYWLAKLKQSHLALLEQMIGEREYTPPLDSNEARRGYDQAFAEINTDLRAKIEELKKQP